MIGGMGLHSIRVKITAITILAILTAIVSIFAASYSTIRRENDRKSGEAMRLISENTQKALEKYIESIEQSVEMVANIAGDTLDSVTLVENGAAGAYARETEQTQEQAALLDAYLSGYCARIQEAFESVASHTQGVVCYYYCINPEISQNEHGFFYSNVGKTGFYEQEPLDARQLDPNDIEHTTWYFTPIQRGRPSWVGPYTAHFLDEMWTYSYLVPIYKAGALIGVLGMDIPFETIVSLVRSIRVYETGFACLFQADGRVLYHPMLPLNTMVDFSTFSIPTDLFQRESSGDELIRFTRSGEDRQMAFTTLSNGLKLVITVPTEEINASWIKLAKMILLITAIVIAVSAVLVMIVMRLIMLPLKRLTAASRRLAEEDYDVELNYKGRDEVGELTGAFSRMRGQMKTYINDLNHRIYTDPLTGLPNMRHFFNLAVKERDLLLKKGCKPVMLYFNLIGMKHFNRQYGFDEGDRLLKEIAEILGRYFDKQYLSRFSEDHFAAVTERTDLEEKLNAVFRDCQQANSGRTLPIRVGIYQDDMGVVGVGVACDRAKFACDQYRGSYISGFYYFDRSMLKKAENNRYIINHIDQAIAERWIEVHYQPIVRAVNGRVCDEEALSRWIDPERGMISPGDFIPVLENARLIYKLDLYVLDEVLRKIQRQREAGLFIVPHSVNLSRSDFDVCDIVEEIRKRVDAAGVERSLITIEITESVIGSDFEFMQEQVNRFQELGFPVWMDDFGSGYSSLDVLQSIKFNLIKFDMSFMKKLDEGDSGKIILTELMKMATSLGVDTVCEGVETEKQVRFLQEIGCSKLQGYYYCKPIPLERILERYEKGIQIGYENPRESAYFEAIGRVNLYDLGMIASGDEYAFQNYFNTLPMGIVEIRGDKARFVRSNQSYRDFLKRFFGFDVSSVDADLSAAPEGTGAGFMNLVRQCCDSGSRAFYDEQMPDGAIVHSFARRVGVNSVTGTTAVAVAVLSITEPSQGASFGSIAKALAADYYNLYYIDIETEKFIEYSSAVGGEELAVERHGENFFAACVRDSTRIYEEDREKFLDAFSKEKVLRAIDKQGVFTITYRLTDTGTPMYVNMKITRMQPDGKHLIMGISIIDAQMKQQQHLEEIQKERDALARVMALSDDYLSLYTVDPETGRYVEYNAAERYQTLGLAKEGEDFFGQSIADAHQAICPEDLPAFFARFTRENVMKDIREQGTFRMAYRLMIKGEPTPVSLKIAMFKEGDEDRLVVGIRAWRVRK